MIGVWDDDSFPTYLRHFFYTIQLNADVLDLVMINRLRTSESKCLDFEKAGVNITWGRNINFHCIDDKEWKRRHVDFLCSSKYGWDCNATEYDDVMLEYRERQDENYNHWRPLRGYVFRDLFPTPDNPFWAWIDHDVFVSNFARYPFNILSQLSILTGSQSIGSESMPEHLIFMAGQLTAFNLDDQALGTAWKKFPALKSVQHFTRYVEEKMPESSEERYWSYGYLRSDDDLPGSELSYAIYPDIHGDDDFDGRWNRQDSRQVYVISGRDILLASATYTRAEIEDLIEMERRDPIDDLGGIGWTGGEDGSAYLLDSPDLNHSEAINLAIVNNSNYKDYSNEQEKDSQYRRRQIHQGILTSEPIQEDCTSNPKWKQCLPPHALTLTSPPIFRSSLIHFKEQKRNHIFRRLERDDRSRGYERKLLKHHLKLKKELWFEFPDFEITRDLVIRYNCDFVEVWRIGGKREETLFWRAREG